jgi:hypothetical protein
MIDSNDAFSGFQSAVSKDVENLVQGTPTWGFWESLLFLDNTIYSTWLTFASYGNIGLCGGLVLTAALTKLSFMPI